MLFDVSVRLASQCTELTSVASTEASLSRLDQALVNKPCIHHTLNLDWTSSIFSESLSQHIQTIGYPGLVLVWLHKDALIPRVALAVSTDDVSCNFYHVRGSAAANPALSALSAHPKDNILTGHQIPESLEYHQIILGFHIEDGASRWLTHSEISSGVSLAVLKSKHASIVGTVRPWSLRP